MRIAFAPIPKELVSKTEFYDYKVPLSKALSDINRLGAVVVTRSGKYYGIADERTISNRGIVRLNPSYPIGKIAKITSTLDKDSSIEHAIINFYHSSVKALPYVEGARVIGIVKRMDILKAMLSLNLLSNEKVREAMTTPIIAINHDATVDQAVNAMKHNRVNRLVVLQNRLLFGMITYRNLMRYSLQTRERAPKYSGSSRFTSDKVADIAEKNLYSISDDRAINDVIRDFVRNNRSSMLVVKKGRPVGMITIRDIFELFARNAHQRKSRILLSGIDENTREYEQDVINELDALAERIGRFKKMEVDYISLNIKRVKSRNYELHARVGLAKSGTVALFMRGFTLDNTLKQLTNKLYNAVKEKKEIIMANRKV